MSYNLIDPLCHPFYPNTYFDSELPFPYNNEDEAWKAVCERSDYSLFETNASQLAYDQSIPVITKVRKLYAQFQAYRGLSIIKGNSEKAQKYYRSIKELRNTVLQMVLGNEYSLTLNRIEACFSGDKATYFKNLGTNLCVEGYYDRDRLFDKIDSTFSPFPYCSSLDRKSMTEDLPYPYLDENKAWNEVLEKGDYDFFERNVQALKADGRYSEIIKLRKSMLQYQSYCVLAASRGDDKKTGNYFFEAGKCQLQLLNLYSSYRAVKEINALAAGEKLFMKKLGSRLNKRFSGFELHEKRERILEILADSLPSQQRLLLEQANIPVHKKGKACSFGETETFSIPARGEELTY